MQLTQQLWLSHHSAVRVFVVFILLQFILEQEAGELCSRRIKPSWEGVITVIKQMAPVPAVCGSAVVTWLLVMNCWRAGSRSLFEIHGNTPCFSL